MKKLCPFILLSLFCINFLSAQRQGAVSTSLSHIKGDITIGAGFNAVYDTGLRGKYGFDNFSEYWNFGIPFYVSGEYYFNNIYSIGSTLSFNKYKEGKYIDGKTIEANSKANFIAFDVYGKYSFRNLLNAVAFEPYVLTGLGINNISEYEITGDPYVVPAETRVNYIFGFGASYWFDSRWAINANVMGKIAFGHDVGDQLQPSLGVKYQLTR